MGNLLYYRGKVLKIGTAEELFVTFRQLYAAYQSGFLSYKEGNCKLSEYFSPGSFLFKFPFPNESNLPLDQSNSENDGREILIDRGDFFKDQMFVSSSHPINEKVCLVLRYQKRVLLPQKKKLALVPVFLMPNGRLHRVESEEVVLYVIQQIYKYYVNEEQDQIKQDFWKIIAMTIYDDYMNHHLIKDIIADCS